MASISTIMTSQYRNRRCLSESGNRTDIPLGEDISMERQQRSHSSPNLHCGRIAEESLFDLPPLQPPDPSDLPQGSGGQTRFNNSHARADGTLQIPADGRGSVDRHRHLGHTPHHHVSQLRENDTQPGSQLQFVGTRQSEQTQSRYNCLSDFLEDILELDNSGVAAGNISTSKENAPGQRESGIPSLVPEMEPTTSCANWSTSSIMGPVSFGYSYTTPRIPAPNMSWSNQTSVIYSQPESLLLDGYHSGPMCSGDQNMNYCYVTTHPPSNSSRPPVPATGKGIYPALEYGYKGHASGNSPGVLPGKHQPSCSHSLGGGTSFNHYKHRGDTGPSVRPKQRLPRGSNIQRVRTRHAEHFSPQIGPGFQPGEHKTSQLYGGKSDLAHSAKSGKVDRGKSLKKKQSHKTSASLHSRKTDPTFGGIKPGPSKPPDERAQGRGAKASTSTSDDKDGGVVQKEEQETIDQGTIDPKNTSTNATPETRHTMLPSFEDEIAGLLSADLLQQLENEFEMFQQEQSYGGFVGVDPEMMMMKTEIPSPMTPPSNLPQERAISPDASLLELENYYYNSMESMPSPTSTVVSEEMEEAYELVMEDILTSIEQRLGISADPTHWTVEHVQAWVSLLVREYGRPKVDLSNFHQVNGFILCQMPEEELERRALDNGYLIYSNLQCLLRNRPIVQREDIKPVISAYQQQQCIEQQQQQQHHSPPHGMVLPPQMTYDPRELYFQYNTVPNVGPTSPAMTDMAASPMASGSSSDEEEPSPPPTGPNTSMTPHHTGAIQLWQFLQELLIQPDSYNYCIRFLDRPQGIFKIEDSVEVARLWGMRKNRPAMNYDKLSRSIRQYYKKEIMKKTEISQRLVYQFVKPF